MAFIKTRLWIIVALSTSSLAAQDKSPSATRDTMVRSLASIQSEGKGSSPSKLSYFHLDFIVRAIDGGQVVSMHRYTIDGNTDPKFRSQLRSNDNIPIKSDDGKSTIHQQTGVSIDCSDLRLIGNEALLLDVTTSFSGIMSPTMQPQPELTVQSGQFEPIVFIGTPTTIFSATGASSKYILEVELIVTPIRLK